MTQQEIKVENAIRVSRPILGETIPISLWRLLRLVAMPRAFGEQAEELDRRQILLQTGEERLRNALSLMTPYYEATTRLERVYRTTEQQAVPISDGWRVGI